MSYTDDKVFSTDSECLQLRNELIKRKIIKPGNPKDIITKGDNKILSSSKGNRELREYLVDIGVIDPNPCAISKGNYSELPEEGEYSPKKILSDEEYNKRKNNYFRIMQEMIFARRDLKLILGKKNENDPDWFF